jgi:glutamate dehydrogenase
VDNFTATDVHTGDTGQVAVHQHCIEMQAKGSAMTNAAAALQDLDVDATIVALIGQVAASWDGTAARMVFCGNATTTRAVLAWPAPQPLLSDVCAFFEHFGLRIARQQDLTHGQAGSMAVSLLDFAPHGPWRPGSEDEVAAAVEASSVHGFVIDDYASLIVSANVSWREVVLVRSAGRFLCQAGLSMSPKYIIETLTEHPEFVAAFTELFRARFDPDIDASRRVAVVTAAEQALAVPVEATTTVDEDRILRAFASFVSATLRTNWFQYDSDGRAKPYAAFLIDSAQLLPRGPIVPFREIFVDCEDVEGIHARGGPVARGGLRFSDRPEDYRTEVLGLMKTQTVKNAPIVPVGAKGAFVRKNSAISVEEAYRTFINGLLDLADNLVEGRPAPPPRTVVYGGEDSYLVVAADKGTARLSDLANAIAVQRGYWLGDAFASGGSAGYDHKKMGITARGAWVSVRRHFEDVGLDVDGDALRVVGIGDMSGDVFGNGMLLSRTIRLIAAFDHRHIFIDPDPDPRASYVERQRLAGLAVSSWADYDQSTLSRGGGVWPRSSKRIVLSSQARTALGITPDALTTEALTPQDVIRAILAADVDLLWNGGIGTYVKSSREGHADAADPANDSIRIDAHQLRATVVGEGGNLGLTQRARIDYALAGGRINADFIDNAAGVATSDREVNLKIALDAARRGGHISDLERADLLDRSLGQVTDSVLNKCEDQVLAISLAEAQAPHLLNRHERLIDNLDRVSGIRRAAEMLPTRAELVSRTLGGGGLTRPEIAVLLAWSKNVVRDELLASAVPDDPIFRPALRSYFPTRFVQRLHADIASHRLAREIIATQIADDLINHVGPGLIYQLDERLGVNTPAVAAAYGVVRELFGVDTMWEQARHHGELTTAQRWDALHEVQQFIEHTAARLLRHHGSRLDIASTIALYRNDIQKLRQAGNKLEGGWPRLSIAALDLSHTARELGTGVARVARIYFDVEALLDLDWIAQALAARTPANRWDAMATAAVRDELNDTHHRLSAAVLRLDGKPETAIRQWQCAAAGAIARFVNVRAELGRDSVIDVARAATVHAELLLLCRHTEAMQT